MRRLTRISKKKDDQKEHFIWNPALYALKRGLCLHCKIWSQGQNSLGKMLSSKTR